jgi:hypothetical protein
MIDHSNYSCDKCAREFSRHCKHCLHTVDNPPTRFERKKKMGTQVPPQYTPPSMPPHSGYVPIASEMPSPPKTGSKVRTPCTYETPCGWCSKWDKKCDTKIPERGLRAKTNPVDDAIDFYYGKCFSCVSDGYKMPQCEECNPENNFKYFQAKEK